MKALFQFVGRITVEDNQILTLFVWLCVGASVGILAYICWYVLQWSAAATWSCVEGSIIDFKEIKNGYGSGIPKMRIRYKYSINGVQYEGDRYQFGFHRDRPISIDLVACLREAATSGSTVKVYVNPGEPVKSSLSIDFDKRGVILLAFIALLAFIPLFVV